MKKYIFLALVCLSSFTIGMIVQLELSVDRLHKAHVSQEWGDNDYSTVWYIITGNGE
jgi:hypothetical protein